MGASFFRNGHKRSKDNQILPVALGWFGIALGAAEILAPTMIARLIGVRPKRLLLPALGLREITSGIGILSRQRTAAWLWSRVAGDAMDLSLLTTAFLSDEPEKMRVQAAAGAVLAVTALDLTAAVQRSRTVFGNDIHVRKAVIVNRPAVQLYSFWRNFENLPRIMRYLESVQTRGGNRSHWVAKGPGGTDIEWDAELTGDRPNQLISWQSLPGADVDNRGSVRFDPATGGRGTVVRVSLNYRTPGGKMGATVAKLFGRDPEQEIELDLYRFKQIMETGQVTSTEGQPVGRAVRSSALYDFGTTGG